MKTNQLMSREGFKNIQRTKDSFFNATAVLKAEIEKVASGTILQGTADTPNSTTFNTNATLAPRISKLITYTDPDGAAWVGGGSGTPICSSILRLYKNPRCSAMCAWIAAIIC